MTQLINLGKMPSKIVFKPVSAGSRKKTVFKYVYSEKHGCPRRVENGEIDIQDMIQAYADDVDFKAIGKMLVDTRDNVKSHFTDMNGEVMDVTGLPRNIHEYEALHNKMKSSFEALPDEVKVLFNNDLDVFKTAWQSGSLGSIFETYEKSQQVTQESEAKE